MNVLCNACKQQFELTGDKYDFVKKAIDKNMTLLMIECDKCTHTVPINPQDLNSIVAIEPQDFILRCPSVGCYGLVSHIDDFYGCGACGSVWTSQTSLLNAIYEIVDRYPYRSEAYNFYEENSLPIHADNLKSQDYDEMVIKELFD